MGDHKTWKSLDNCKIRKLRRRYFSEKCSRLLLPSSCSLPLPSRDQDFDIGGRFSPVNHASDLAVRTLSVLTEFSQVGGPQDLKPSDNPTVSRPSEDLEWDKVHKMCSDHLEHSIKFL